MDQQYAVFKEVQAKTRRELIQQRTATNARLRTRHHAACAAAAAAGQPAPREPKYESLTISVKDLGLTVAAPAAAVFTHARCAAAALTVGAYPATRNDVHHSKVQLPADDTARKAIIEENKRLARDMEAAGLTAIFAMRDLWNDDFVPNRVVVNSAVTSWPYRTIGASPVVVNASCSLVHMPPSSYMYSSADVAFIHLGLLGFWVHARLHSNRPNLQVGWRSGADGPGGDQGHARRDQAACGAQGH